METRTIRHTSGGAVVVTNVPADRVHTDGTVEEAVPTLVAPREFRIDGMREVFRADAGQEVDLQALESFLKGGRVAIDGWDQDAMLQLGEEISSGESVLGLDYRGIAKRVVSVAKPVLYDGEHILVEAFQSFPTKKPKVKCSGMSEKFSAATESSEEACKRALMEELKMDLGCVTQSGGLPRLCLAPHRDSLLQRCRTMGFGPRQLIKVDAFSQKFCGLESEYHLYYMLAEPRACAMVQERIPKSSMTPICTNFLPCPGTLCWAGAPWLVLTLNRLCDSTFTACHKPS